MFCFCIFQLKLACKYKACELNLFSKVTKIRHGEGNGNALQYSCLQNPTDRGVWQSTARLFDLGSTFRSMGSKRVRHDLVTKQDKAKKKKNSVYLSSFHSLPYKLGWLDYMNAAGAAAAAKSLQSCPTLSDPMDCSLPGSSVHGVFQARVLEWGAIAFSDMNASARKLFNQN